MRVRLGLTHPSPAWEQLAQQEGVPYEIVDSNSTLDVEEYSLLVVCQEPNAAAREEVRSYLHGGGAVIGYVAHLSGLEGCESRPQYIDYVVADHDEVFPDVHVLDLGLDGAIPREANCLRLDSNSFALYAGALGGGFAVLLPFDVSKVLSDPRAELRQFYAYQERLPSERVSATGKGETRQLIRRSFEWLHQVRGIPYVHLWYFPDGKLNLFAFRIDTDGASREEVEELYDAAVRHHVGMSWYLDVKSHEQWLHRFAAMDGQEIGVHCYDHATYDNTEANVSNIARARSTMETAGLTPEGFTAPFGVWHSSLAEALDRSGFAYSSEFSCAYDTFPFFPESAGKRHSTLQVPIHPVCIGSLNRIGYEEKEMTAYFRTMVDWKLGRQEPLFFYHHPAHRRWSVVEDLFREVRQAKITNVTLGDFARWWRRRLSIRPDIRVNGREISITVNGPPGEGEAWLRIVRQDGQEAITPMRAAISLDALQWQPRRIVRPPADIRRIREFDPRTAIGDLYSRFIRKFA